jgi:hypothetical protein
MATGYGLASNITNSGTGTIATAYGLYTDLNISAGAVTNYTGLMIVNPGRPAFTVNTYGIYSDGSTFNYMAGRLGVANAMPAYPVDVTGDINTTTQLRIAGVVMCTAAGCNAVSDSRLKENVRPMKNSLEQILKLQGVSYSFIDKKRFGSQPQIGFLAQDLEKVFPQVVKTDEDSGLKTVAYDHLAAPLIEAFKELYSKWSGDHALLGKLEQKVENEAVALRAENKALKDRLDKIEVALAKSNRTLHSVKQPGLKLVNSR